MEWLESRIALAHCTLGGGFSGEFHGPSSVVQLDPPGIQLTDRTKPVITELSLIDDTGPSGFQNDNRTNLLRPRIAGTVLPASANPAEGIAISLDLDSDGLFDDAGPVFSDAAGGYSFEPEDFLENLNANTVVFVNAQAEDQQGRLSDPFTLRVEVDTLLPTVANVQLADDDGVSRFPQRTNDRTPSFSGRVSEMPPFNTTRDVTGLPIDLDITRVGGDFTDGISVTMEGYTTETDSFGPFLVTSNQTLPEGFHTAAIRVTDKAGNVAEPKSLTFEIDLTAPRITSFVAVPNPINDRAMLNAPPQNLVVTFDADDVDPRTVESHNIQLLNSRNENCSDALGLGQATLEGHTLTIPMVYTLADTVYAFVMNAGVTDTAGNSLDGEFSGSYPTGDGQPGGDFRVSFAVDATPPTVDSMGLDARDEVVTSISSQARRTNKGLPAFVGMVRDASPVVGEQLLVQLDISATSQPSFDPQNDFDDGTAVAGPDGSFVIRPDRTLPDGPISVLARVVDAAGNVSQPFAVAGQSIVVDTTPPRIERISALSGRRGTTIAIAFSEGLASDEAADTSRYEVRMPGRDRTFGTADDRVLPHELAYASSPDLADHSTAFLHVRRRLAKSKQVQVIVQPMSGLDGNQLVGNTDNGHSVIVLSPTRSGAQLGPRQVDDGEDDGDETPRRAFSAIAALFGLRRGRQQHS